jgi:GntR family transcriptional regulator
MKLSISNTSELPIYAQIKGQIKEAILSGDLPENTTLPSLRKLAAGLKISVLTTSRAYRELEEEGFVTSVQGKGCYVMPRGSKLIREQLLREIERGLGIAIEAAEKAGILPEELHDLLSDMLGDAEVGAEAGALQ